MKKSHNGWTNYATWRVNLEILGDIEFDHPVTYDYLEEIVEGIVFDNTFDKDCLAADYARAFIHEVDFEEIAEAINKEISLQN
tara:strand:+ start:555 stop:803 length:249 start_codon:yes stop_codon:yes gene_type:complete